MSLANYLGDISSCKPEVVICITVLALLLLNLLKLDRFCPPFAACLLGGVVSLVFAGQQFLSLIDDPSLSGCIFGGMLTTDCLGASIRCMLCLFLVLFVALTVLTEMPSSDNAVEFYVLVFGAVLGMMVLCQASNLLMLFVGVEMASVPSYGLVGFIKGSRKSSEAALKYVIYGAGASGTMLFGISIIAGSAGSADYVQLLNGFSTLGAHTDGVDIALTRSIVFGVSLVLAGFAYKLSVVPFHFWSPDAFEGATAEVGAFLSVSSKVAAFGALVRFVVAICGRESGVLTGSLAVVALGVAAIACITVCFGNLAAYSQRDLRRMLAYSTVAHAGYMLLGVACLFICLTTGRTIDGFRSLDVAQTALEGLLFYLFCYLFMNLGAFGVAALLRAHIRGQAIDDFDGVGLEAPGVGIAMCVCVFGLVGLPPLGGFVGKFEIFAATYAVGEAHWMTYPILVVVALNAAVSLVFYIRVLRGLFLRQRRPGSLPLQLPVASTRYAMLIALPVLLLGLFPHYTSNLALRVAESVLR